MRKIIKNAIKCNRCGDIIISKNRHDYVTRSCERCSVDGGNNYLKRDFTDSINDYTELSQYEGENE